MLVLSAECGLELDHRLPAEWDVIRVHNLAAEREACHRDHLKVGQRGWDAHDGHYLCRRGGDVANSQPQAGDHEPDDVGKGGHGAAALYRLHHRAAKWPQGEISHAERCDARGDGDDEDAGDDAKDEVGQG